MSESFWFMAGEDEESAAPVDHAPFQEPMRGDRKLTNAPSTDQKKVRRQIHRSGELEDREAAYGEGGYQHVIKPEDLPKIPVKDVRRQDPLHELMPDMIQYTPPYPQGFDEPFQRERFDQKMKGREVREQRAQMPEREKTNEGRAADNIADRIGEVGTERGVQDAYSNPDRSKEDNRLEWFKDKWNKTFEPLGLSEEGKTRSRNQTRDRWSKVVGATACEHPNCPPWEHKTGRTATVLNTQVERLNKGDMVRTPTGQSSSVKGIRPHETDSTLMYMDTDQGTSTVKRGTDFQVVPHNSQQQELPDIGNPMNSGNTGQVPGGGHGAGGPVTPGSTGTPAQCPNCGNSGTMRMHSGTYICSVCGFTIAAGGSPGGLLFSNQEHGYAPTRRKPGEVPKAHVWASKYAAQTESQFARHIRQAALGGDK